MAPVVAACQAMRGVAFLTAVTFVAVIGDVRRFETPRQLMAYLGLVPYRFRQHGRLTRSHLVAARSCCSPASGPVSRIARVPAGQRHSF
jgi:transposase